MEYADYAYEQDMAAEAEFEHDAYLYQPITRKCFMCCGSRTMSQAEFDKAGWLVTGGKSFCPVDVGYAMAAIGVGA